MSINKAAVAKQAARKERIRKEKARRALTNNDKRRQQKSAHLLFKNTEQFFTTFKQDGMELIYRKEQIKSGVEVLITRTNKLKDLEPGKYEKLTITGYERTIERITNELEPILNTIAKAIDEISDSVEPGQGRMMAIVNAVPHISQASALLSEIVTEANEFYNQQRELADAIENPERNPIAESADDTPTVEAEVVETETAEADVTTSEAVDAEVVTVEPSTDSDTNEPKPE